MNDCSVVFYPFQFELNLPGDVFLKELFLLTGEAPYKFYALYFFIGDLPLLIVEGLAGDIEVLPFDALVGLASKLY